MFLRPRCVLLAIAACATCLAIGVVQVIALDGPIDLSSSEHNGVKVHWRYTPSDSAATTGLGRLAIEIADARSATPLRYERGRLAAWLQRRRDALSDAETPCTDRVKALAAQGIGGRADIDVNTHRLLTLNADGTLVFINPFVGLNNAKLESIVDLGGEPTGWLAIPDRMEAWIAIEPGKLLAIDLQERRIVRTIDLPSGSAPRALAFDAPRNLLWVAMPGHDVLGRLDLSAPSSSIDIVAAPEVVDIVSLDGAAVSPRGVVSLHNSGDLVLRDGASAVSWQIGERPVAVRYSALARRIIAAGADGLIAWIDPAQPGRIERQLRADHPVRLLSLIDDGRQAIAVGAGKASLIDLASARTTLLLRAPQQADQIVQSSSFAYAIDSRAARATMWSLADLRAGRDTSADVMLGRANDATSALAERHFQTAVPSPDNRGLVSASRADGMLYQFAEGMMAPIGSYSNYRRAPLSIGVLDLGLREIDPGHYVTTIRHRRGGAYELLVSGIGPSFASCSRLDLPNVAIDGEVEEARIRAGLVAVGPPGRQSGEPQAIEIRLERRGLEGASEAVVGVQDLTILIFDRLSGWQVRVPLKETQHGRYAAQVSVPRAANYELHASSASSNLSFAQGRIGAATLGGSP
jgi:hypothetical protein